MWRIFQNGKYKGLSKNKKNNNQKMMTIFTQGIVHDATAEQAAFYAEILYTVGISFENPELL